MKRKRHAIEKRMSEIRESLNAETPPAETEAEPLRNELRACERELRGALDEEAKAIEEAATAKEVEVRSLAERVECRRYLQAAMTESKLDGAEDELRQELKLPEGGMPWAALDPEPVEVRADTATTIADSVVSKPRMSIIRRVFQRTDAAWLGVETPSAPVGTPNYPVMTAGATGEMAAAGAEVDADAATFTGTTIEPTRATARYLYRVEDAAKFADLESTLRADLRTVLGILFDQQVVGGDGTGANLSGFIKLADTTGAANPSAKATLADFDTAFADGLDGLYAHDLDEVRILLGRKTLQFLRTNRVTGNTNGTFAQLVTANGGVYRSSERVAAPTSDVQKAYRFRPAEMRMIAPIWEGIQLVRDPYSGAAKGEVALTVLMLFGYAQPRGKAKEVRFKLA